MTKTNKTTPEKPHGDECGHYLCPAAPCRGGARCNVEQEGAQAACGTCACPAPARKRPASRGFRVVVATMLAAIACGAWTCDSDSGTPCELACLSIDEPTARAKCESKCEEGRVVSQPQGNDSP